MTSNPTHETPTNPEQRAQRAADILNQHHNGWSFRRIAQHHGLHPSTVHEIYWTTLRAIPVPAVNELRAKQNARLEQLVEHANEIRARRHLALSGGGVVTQIVKDAEGNEIAVEVEDDGPALAALRELRLIEAEIGKLNGTYAPVQATINGTVAFEIGGIDPEVFT